MDKDKLKIIEMDHLSCSKDEFDFGEYLCTANFPSVPHDAKKFLKVLTSQTPSG